MQYNFIISFVMAPIIFAYFTLLTIKWRTIIKQYSSVVVYLETRGTSSLYTCKISRNPTWTVLDYQGNRKNIATLPYFLKDNRQEEPRASYFYNSNQTLVIGIKK